MAKKGFMSVTIRQAVNEIVEQQIREQKEKTGIEPSKSEIIERAINFYIEHNPA
jgi:hypothetical protein